jgi:uncharacterized protein with von Willebrand factor type A (vWA) domain
MPTEAEKAKAMTMACMETAVLNWENIDIYLRTFESPTPKKMPIRPPKTLRTTASVKN